jgi:hypothetical protein
MRVAFGLKAHSGWAALVVIGIGDGELYVVDRRRIELVENDAVWAMQPYHAAEELEPDEAREVVKRGIESARRIAAREMRAAVKRTSEAGHEIAACSVLVPAPMPDWSVEQILAVHIRMHKAEGVLFPDALVRAARKCGLNVVTIPEKLLSARAEEALAAPLNVVSNRVAALGKSVGPPWGKDQKNAAVAAMIAFERPSFAG